MYKIKNFVIFTALSFLFFVSGFAIPFAGFFFIPLSSVSLVLLLVKNGIPAGLLGIILAALAIYRFIPFGGIFTFVFILLVVLNSLFLYSGIIRKKRARTVVLDSCIAVSFVSVVVILSFTLSGFRIDWIFEKIAAALPKEISSGAVMEIITDNIYSITAISCIIMVLLSYIFLSQASKRFNADVKKLQSFEKWRMQEEVIFVFIASLLFYAVFKHMKNAVFFQISGNILNLVLFFYFIGGLALGKFLFRNSKIMLAMAYLIFFFYLPAAVFLGVADVWLDFRKKKEDKKDEGYLKTGG